MGSSSNTDKQRPRKNKKPSASKSAPPLPSQSEPTDQGAYSSVSEPPRTSPDESNTNVGKFQATPIYHGQPVHSSQQSAPYANVLNSEYSGGPQPLAAPGTPRHYAMYGDSGAARSAEATAPSLVVGGASQQESYWYDANGVLFINTERGLVPAAQGPDATNSNAVRLGYPGLNFMSPSGTVPASPSTVASTSGASATGVNSDALSSALTPASTVNPAGVNAPIAASSGAGAASALIDPMAVSPRAMVPPSPAVSTSGHMVRANPARQYYDTDSYNQGALAGRGSSGMAAMPANYSPSVSMPHSDFGGPPESTLQFREPPYEVVQQSAQFRGVSAPPAYPQILHQVPAWKPPNYPYGYYPYVPPAAQHYEHPVWSTADAAMPPPSGHMAATPADGAENRDATVEGLHSLSGTEKPHLGGLSPSEGGHSLEGMGQMTTDAQGIPWLKFEYSRDRVQCSYQIRCDIENVDESLFSEAFREENCIYPGAMVPAQEYKGHRQHYETECNQIGWRLAFRNSILQNRRGLIQRAVDTYRNSSHDLSTRSRRARRILKQQEKERQRLIQEQQQQQHPQLPKRRPRPYWPQ